MRYDDLDEETRRWMLIEFREEEARSPYRSPSLSAMGRVRFHAYMEQAVVQGGEDTLAKDLEPRALWSEYEPSPLGGVRRTEPARAAHTLAHQEFNTWYVRGLCRRLLEEGEGLLQIYLAGDSEIPGDECTAYENMVLEVRFVYQGHRAKYFPTPNPRAFSIPCGPQCCHSVRRIPGDMKAMLELEERQFGAAFRRTGH
jgi:hypothetical protein